MATKPLRIGDWCMLNSGGPPMLIVDQDSKNITVALKSDLGITEYEFPSAMFKRTTARSDI